MIGTAYYDVVCGSTECSLAPGKGPWRVARTGGAHTDHISFGAVRG